MSEAVSSPEALAADQSFHSEDETLHDIQSSSSSSSSSNVSWGDDTVAEMKFTMISNLLFFVSSTIQSIMAMSDLRNAKAKALLVDDDLEDDAWDETYVYTFGDKVYYFFFSLAPFLCLMSALLDVHYFGKFYTTRCFCSRRGTSNTVMKMALEENLDQYHFIVQVDDHNDDKAVEDIDDNNDDEDSDCFSVVDSNTTSAHWHLAAAIVFGIAAALEFYCTFLYDYYEDVDYWDDDSYLIEEENKRKWYVSNYRIDFMGMHLYLLSGILALIAQRSGIVSRCNWLCRSANTNTIEYQLDTESSDGLATLLTVLGTTLFISGTLMDCTIAWLSDPLLRRDLRVHMQPITISKFGLTSCLCWSVDAVLYIWADVLIYSLHLRGSEGRWLLRGWFCNDYFECKSKQQQQENNGLQSILIAADT